MFESASLHSMDPTIAATAIGVLLSVCFGAFATAFAWLRADMNARFERLETRFERLETRLGQLEATVQALVMTLGRGGRLTDPGDPHADHDPR